MREASHDMPEREPAPSGAARPADVGRRAEERADRAAAAQEQLLDRVADASIESFPASDPPSWTTMRLGPPGGEEATE